MNRFRRGCFLLLAVTCLMRAAPNAPVAQRVVILKIDGLNADLLNRLMEERNPETGKSFLPWMSHIFRENGTIFENFYTRGISLSAPSWSMLDTGRHTIIRGNVEYDRFTGRIYDYLNFFPFYLNYARRTQVDMSAVEVLDRAGIPLVIDSFPYDREYQSFQLLQRGVRWATLRAVLKRRVKSQFFLTPVEGVGPESLDELLGHQMEEELDASSKNAKVVYLDYYTGDIDHQGHATNQVAALRDSLQHIDALAGRIWTNIQKSPLAKETVFVAVSDHGMNNRSDVFSQAFNLPDFFNSAAGGGHHVITNRHQLSDFKLVGLDPTVQRVINKSNESYYLAGESARYPTAWLDLDGNERAAVQLRNSDFNRIQILLQQLSRPDLSHEIRLAATTYLQQVVDAHRPEWVETEREMNEELSALKDTVDQTQDEVKGDHHKWTAEERDRGEDKIERRVKRDLSWWQRESASYHSFLTHLQALLNFHPDSAKPFRGSIEDLVPAMTLFENNTAADLQNYVIGLSDDGLSLGVDGNLDPIRSFRTLNYFPLLMEQTARNNPQAQLTPHPIDFIALRLSGAPFPEAPLATNIYWLYGGEKTQLLVLSDSRNRLRLLPIAHLVASTAGATHWESILFAPGLPLHLYEDPGLDLPAGADRAAWLIDWHTEQEWLRATHRCRYSNGVIGITEELSPAGANVPGSPGLSPVLKRYERRRRELVQADFHIFAADGWNFNARNFNPGGNHGSFFRISTHSVWMMAGAGTPVQRVEQPLDSLNFASTILSLMGKPAPDPGRIFPIRQFHRVQLSDQQTRGTVSTYVPAPALPKY